MRTLLAILLLALFSCPGCHTTYELGNEGFEGDRVLTITSRVAMRMTRGSETSYYAFYGTPQNPTTATIKMSSPDVTLAGEGMVYVSGMRPIVRSTRVIAAASGTSLSMSVEGQRHVVHVYSCKAGDEVVVTLKNDPNRPPLRVVLREGQTAISEADGDLRLYYPSAPAPITDAVAKLVEQSKNEFRPKIPPTAPPHP